MGDEYGNMGNFKGVMLCNRPAQIPGSLQAVVGAANPSGPSRPAFISSVVPDSPAGLPPIRKNRPSIRREPKFKDADVTWRHKRWLQEFADRRASIAKHFEAQMAKKEDRLARFNDRSQQMRDAIRQVQSDNPSDKEAITRALAMGPGNEIMLENNNSKRPPSNDYSPSNSNNNSYESESKQQMPQPPDSNSGLGRVKPAGRKKPRARHVKPGWARTEAEDEDIVDQEAEDLIGFAQGLDYDSYIDDLEVREALKFVHDRVKSVEEKRAEEEREQRRREEAIARGEDPDAEYEDVEEDDPDGKTNENGEIIRRTVRRMKQQQAMAENNLVQPEWNSSTRLDERESRSARGIESTRPLRNIHSSASVRAIMEKQKHTSSLPPISDAEPSMAFSPPVIVTHDNPAKSNTPGNRQVDPNNLPYLYRHPAI